MTTTELSVIVFICNAFVIWFIQSQNNKNVLKYNGYLYRFDKKYKSTVYWRCNESLCKSRINLKTEEIEYLTSTVHYHFLNISIRA
jgi:hypothetical protein